MAKNIGLLVTGSVASIRTIREGENTGLVEELQKNGFNVTVVATDFARQYGFIDTQAVREVSGNPVYTTREFDKAFDKTDILVVSPSSANTISQIANQTSEIGEALASSDKPKLISPAMNDFMWQHPATQRNIRTLASHGWKIAGPVIGQLACGENGFGRMLPVVKIAEAVTSLSRGQESEHFDVYKQSLIANYSLPKSIPENANNTRNILVVVQGGQDAGSIYEIVESLKANSCNVTCALSADAFKSINKERLGRISGNIVYTHHYQVDKPSKEKKGGMEHINLSRQHDLLVFPSVNRKFAEEMVTGAATDFVSDTYLATNKPVVIIPSLSPHERPTNASIERLKQDGAIVMQRTNSKEITTQICNLLERQIEK